MPVTTIKVSEKFKLDYGTYKIYKVTAGEQAIDFEATVPDGTDAKKFESAFRKELQKEIQLEESSAKSIRELLTSFEKKVLTKPRTVPRDDIISMIEMINGSIKSREDFMAKKFKTLCEGLIAERAALKVDKDLIKKLKRSAVIKIVRYTVVALAVVSVSIAAAVLSGGILALPAALLVIKSVTTLGGAIKKSYGTYKTLASNQAGIVDKVKDLLKASEALEKLLANHRAQLAVDRDNVAAQSIHLKSLHGQLTVFKSASDPAAIKKGVEAEKKHDELYAALGLKTSELTQHETILASARTITLEIAKLEKFKADFDKSWKGLSGASKLMEKLEQGGELMEFCSELKDIVA